MRLLAAALLGLSALVVSAPSPAAASPLARASLAELAPEVLDLRAREDGERMKRFDASVGRLLRELRERRALFDRPKDQPLEAEERAEALALFQSVLDHAVALDALSSFHFDFWRIHLVKDPARHARHFALAFAAYCEQLRLGLAFVDATIDRPQFEKLFDEGAPEYGIPKGAYARLKWNVVHVEDLGRLASAWQYHRLLAKTAYAKIGADGAMPFLKNAIEARYADVRDRLKRRGVRLFAKNGVDIVKDGGHRAWFPVQARVAEAMGDTKVRRKGEVFIDPAQVALAVRRAQPGDVLVARQNWYLSNVGLPGFWPHAQLWVGSPDELAAFFDGDAEVEAAYGGRFVEFLKRRHPDAWLRYAAPDEHGRPRRVVEAISDGVTFTTAEHALHADYSAAMRPRLSKRDVAAAVERAFSYAGRPYDFDFDFYTDQTLVCSELVVKAYEPREGVRGLKMPLERIMGRMTLGPNSLVRMFDAEHGTPAQQLDFVWFLDGSEATRSARFSSLEELRGSHARPKWDIAQE